MENSGEGKTYHKTPPQNGFGSPPPIIRFPPPFVHAMSFSLEETPRAVLEGALYSTFPPQNRTMRFAPPFAISQVGVDPSLLKQCVSAYLSPVPDSRTLGSASLGWGGVQESRQDWRGDKGEEGGGARQDRRKDGRRVYHWTKNYYITSRYFSELIAFDVLYFLHQ